MAASKKTTAKPAAKRKTAAKKPATKATATPKKAARKASVVSAYEMRVQAFTMIFVALSLIFAIAAIVQYG